MRLAKLQDEYGTRLQLEWKAFLLRPHPQPKPLDRFRRYTKSWQRVAEQAGASEGGRFREWATDEDPPSHSIPPNVAVKAAARLGAFERYHLNLMDAYFYENRNVTDRGTIVDVAVSSGIDEAAFVSLLDDGGIEDEVIAEYKDAISRGITGVPTVVMAGGFAIPGAQDMTFYRRLVDKTLEKAAAGEA